MRAKKQLFEIWLAHSWSVYHRILKSFQKVMQTCPNWGNLLCEPTNVDQESIPNVKHGCFRWVGTSAWQSGQCLSYKEHARTTTIHAHGLVLGVQLPAMERKIITTADAMAGQWMGYNSPVTVYLGKVYEGSWEEVKRRKLGEKLQVWHWGPRPPLNIYGRTPLLRFVKKTYQPRKRHIRQNGNCSHKIQISFGNTLLGLAKER